MKIPLSLSLTSVVCLAMTLGCASNRSAPPSQVGLSLLSKEIKQELRSVSESTVGINTTIAYDVYQYSYLKRDGALIPDPDSPMKYRLDSRNDDSGIFTTTDQKTLSGGGLILDFDHLRSRYIILTSSHLVAPEDTTDIYFLDEYGRPTDVVFMRYVVKSKATSVRGQSHWAARANVLFEDSINDLAIVTVATNNRLGIEFGNEIGYEADLGWGDWVFLFGYPKGVKQLTGGWVSRGPYRNSLAVDAVVRFGYSGGPVFALSREKNRLEFVGLIKSVPSSTLQFIAPDGTLPSGYRLSVTEINRLFVKTEMVVEYGTAYFVDPETMKRFFEQSEGTLQRNAVELDRKYYGR